MAKTNTADIGFEKEIWKAADLLRGNLDASEYKSVVLGLIFLKYISDRFEAKYNALVAEGDGFEEDKDEYTSENIFFVPQEARWSVVAEAAHTPEVGTVIDNAMRLIEKENVRLKGILPKNFARPELDKRRLGDVVDLFTNIQMKEHGDTKDILGRTYEYCLSKFAEAEGNLPESSIRQLVLSVHWLKCSNPIADESMIHVVVREVCLCNLPNSLKGIKAISTTFPYSGKTATRPLGKWRR